MLAALSFARKTNAITRLTTPPVVVAMNETIATEAVARARDPDGHKLISIVKPGAEPPPLIGNVMKAFVPTGNETIGPTDWCMVRKNFTSTQSEVWISFDWAIDSATAGVFLVSGGGADVVATGSALNALYHTMFPEHNGSNYWYLSGGTDDEGALPVIVADTWFTIEFHFKQTTDLLELYVNGSLSVATTEGSGSPINHFMLGHMQNSPVAADASVYFKNVKAGTTRGASDLFADDFSSGDLSNWDVAQNGHGTLSVVSDPY